MEHDGSLPCSQEPLNGPCPEPHQSVSTSYNPVSLKSILILYYNLRVFTVVKVVHRLVVARII
jgi:hypothetical protein